MAKPRPTTYRFGEFKLRIEKLDLEGGSFGIRATLFKKNKRIKRWPNGWRTYSADTDSSEIVRDLVRFMNLRGVNVGELNNKVLNLLS